jgi:DNA polymerase III epsilon subunit-like protein
VNSPWFVIDVETGGLDPQRHAILTLGLAVLDTASGQIAALELPINDPHGDVTEEALRKNRLDPVQVRRTGLSPEEAVSRLEEFILPHLQAGQKAVLAGHNVAFDIAFLRRLYRLAAAEDDFNARYGYRAVDLHSAYMLLAEAGLVPWLPRASLDAIALSLGVPQDPDRRHTALGDAITTARCLWELLERARSAARAPQLQPESRGRKKL